MRVNFTSPAFLHNRLMAGAGIPALLLVIFLCASSFKRNSDRDLWTKQVNLMIRHIGHRLLLQAGDATSPVLPVIEINKGRFLLQFEKELVFNHDSLIALSRGSFSKADFPAGYTVTVNDRIKGDIIYGFKVNNSSADILACIGRSQPQGLYSIEFAFPDFYEETEQKTADVGRLTASTKVEPREMTSNPKEIKTASLAYGISQQLEKPESKKVDPQPVNPKLEQYKTKTSNYPSMNLVYAGMLVLIGASLAIWRFGRNIKPMPGQNENDAMLKAPVPEGTALGQFLFDVENKHLSSGNGVIPLTGKECKVLQLLHKNFGVLVPRETLMQEVWINEGVITSRSLDMFISKLRKKLSIDQQVRITNIHGKGYRLEMVNDGVT